MKIAVISNQAFSLLNFRGPLMAEMVARGHGVLAFAPDFNEESRTALAALGVQTVDYSITRSGTNPLKEITVILQLRRLLRIHRPDLCLSYFIKPVIYGTIAAWMSGISKRFGIIEGLGFAFTPASKFDLRRWAAQRLVAFSMRLAAMLLDKIIFLNPDDLNEFLGRRLTTRARSRILGAIGLDLDEWPLTPLPDAPLTFILVARLLRDKGIGEYAAAARILRADYPGLRFLVLGGVDDNPASITRREMEAWETEGLIEWPGHAEARPWLAKAHVFVLPSYYREGIPRSTQEAMAMGRAIITTDAPGCRETVIEGHNGFMIPPRDHVALARAMRHFTENPEDITRMGLVSRKLACERFDVHVQNGKLLGFMGL